MKSKLEKAYDPESFRALGHEIVDQLADYLRLALDGDITSVLPDRDPDDLYQKYLSILKEKDSSNFVNLVQSFLEDSIHIHHPGYIGHQVCAPAPLGAIAGLLGDLMNNGSAVFEMGPANTAMEKVLIDLTCRRLGYDEKSDGVFTSGGSLGNLTALLAAKRIKSQNLQENKLPAFLVSDQCHYSIAKSLKIIGIHQDGIIPIPADASFRMRCDQIEPSINQAEQDGFQVIGIVANACSTATGVYDDLEQISSLTEKRNLWLHVDGAHGAAVAFSNRYKHLIKGIEQADSVVLDFHKMLMAPALITAVLFKDSTSSYRTFAEKASYLWNGKEYFQWFNFSKRTLECTKRSLGLKVFMLLKAFGEELYAENIDRLYDMAKTFTRLLNNRNQLQVAVEPQSNIVCFRLLKNGFNRDQLNVLNQKVKDKILQNEQFYIVQADLNGSLYLRTTLMNPFTSEKDLEKLLDEIENAAAELEASAR